MTSKLGEPHMVCYPCVLHGDCHGSDPTGADMLTPLPCVPRSTFNLAFLPRAGGLCRGFKVSASTGTSWAM